MDVFQKLRDQLDSDGFAPSEARWGNMRVLTGQKRTFKWRWGATALWENVIAFETRMLDVPNLTAMIEHARRWAIANKRGWLRGLQSGQAILVVVVADEITRAAREMARQTWKIEFARFTVVAATDGRTATIAKGPTAVGAIYRPHLTKRLSNLVAP